jgi:hypothetical protein
MMSSGAFERKKPTDLGGLGPPYRFDEGSLSLPYGGTPNSMHPASYGGNEGSAYLYQPPQGPPPHTQYQPPQGPPPHPFAHIPNMAAAHDGDTDPALYYEAAQKLHEHHEQHKQYPEQQHHVPSGNEQYESHLQAHAQAYG